jgi:hypothetical protein
VVCCEGNCVYMHSVLVLRQKERQAWVAALAFSDIGQKDTCGNGVSLLHALREGCACALVYCTCTARGIKQALLLNRALHTDVLRHSYSNPSFELHQFRTPLLLGL